LEEDAPVEFESDTPDQDIEVQGEYDSGTGSSIVVSFKDGII
jgi:hypothetical protein